MIDFEKNIMSLFIACALICCIFIGFPASAASTQSNIVVKMSDFYNINSNNRRELSNHLKQKFENQCMLTFEGNKNTLDKKQIYDDIGISCGFSTASIDNEAKKWTITWSVYHYRTLVGLLI